MRDDFLVKGKTMIKPLDASPYATDKAQSGDYLKHYETRFAGLRLSEIALLELGINEGGSLLMWRDYFSRGQIAGLDLKPVTLDDHTGRVHVYQGAQQDLQLLSRIAREMAPDGFDIIIDDCAHLGELSRASFRYLFTRHLKSGGVYVLEDWGTGYWPEWMDGAPFNHRAARLARDEGARWMRFLAPLSRVYNSGLARRNPILKQVAMKLKERVARRQFHSHACGMAGFVQELVDECARDDIAHGLRETQSRIADSYLNGARIAEMTIYNGQVFLVKA